MSYDERYSKKEFYWGLDPVEMAIEGVKYLIPNNHVLDIGCGEGRNSIFLAKNKLNVTCFDISKDGIKKVNKLFNDNNLELKSEVTDIAGFFLKNSKKFDGIFALNVLQFLNESSIYSVINKIKSSTKLGGVNVIESFVVEDKFQKEKVLSKGKYFFDEGELRKIYEDWDILYYKEYLGDWETHGQPKHRHFIVDIIAKRLR